MSSDLIDSIRLKRLRTPEQLPLSPPKHQPEMLYIGCIDARLDPIMDIGIPKGKALIYRNIAAIVPQEIPQEMIEAWGAQVVAHTGEIQENVSIGAALEFFLNYLPAAPGRPMKHIVVSGHTDCGGIRACMEETARDARYLPKHLAALQEMRHKVLEQGDCKESLLPFLEHASVRQSVMNLMTYDVVKQALAEERAQLHGWVINTANQSIEELNIETGEFLPMSSEKR